MSNMRPGGFSSEEDDDNDFSFDGDTKTTQEKKEELARELYEQRKEIENSATNRLYRALVSRNLNAITTELDGGIDIESPVYNANYTPLYLAATLGDFTIVNELLKRGANAKNDLDGFTCLMAACSCKKNSTTFDNILNIIQKLLEHGANILSITRQRKILLMFACEQGFIEVVRMLLPLSDLGATDNLGWTALFYAAHTNSPEIVKFLLENGANDKHVDIRGNDVKFYANCNNLFEILKVLPQDEEAINPECLMEEYDYEQIFESLKDNEKPSFKSDMKLILYGMKCEKLISIFNKKDVDLFTLLTLNDIELQNIGVKMSFQRGRILQGLYRFHSQNWRKTTIPFNPTNPIFTTNVFFAVITTAIKHNLVMEASLKYIIENLDNFISEDDKKQITSKSFEILRIINQISALVKILHKKAIQLDKYGGQPDIITKGFSFQKNTLKKKLAITFAGISTIFFMRYLQLRLLPNNYC